MPENALTPYEIAKRQAEIAAITADQEHYFSEHVQIASELHEAILQPENVFKTDAGLSRVCSKGHIISVVFKGKLVVPEVSDRFRPVAYRRPSI